MKWMNPRNKSRSVGWSETKEKFRRLVSAVDETAKLETQPGNLYGSSEVYSYAISALGCLLESETNLHIFRKPVPEEPNSLYRIPGVVCVSKRVAVDLSKVNVISSPWDSSRFQRAMQSVFQNGFRADWNATNGLFYQELNLAIIENGKHHIAVGRLYKEGTAKLNIYSLEPLFPTVRTDGEQWYSVDGIMREPVLDYRFAAMYELSRLRAALLADTPRAVRYIEPKKIVVDPEDDAANWRLFDQLETANREIYALRMENERKAKIIAKLHIQQSEEYK